MTSVQSYAFGVLQGLTVGLAVAMVVELRSIKRTLDLTLEEVRRPRRTGPPIRHAGDSLDRFRQGTGRN